MSDSGKAPSKVARSTPASTAEPAVGARVQAQDCEQALGSEKWAGDHQSELLPIAGEVRLHAPRVTGLACPHIALGHGALEVTDPPVPGRRDRQAREERVDVEAAVDAGFILRPEADAMIATAEQSAIGTNVG